MPTEGTVLDLSRQLGLEPSTVRDLLNHGWAYVIDEKPGRWESFAYRMTVDRTI